MSGLLFGARIRRSQSQSGRDMLLRAQQPEPFKRVRHRNSEEGVIPFKPRISLFLVLGFTMWLGDSVRSDQKAGARGNADIGSGT
jgi:hypothetical protein